MLARSAPESAIMLAMTDEKKLLDRAYYLLRAEGELRQARQATCREAALAHFHIAGVYLDRVHRLLAPGVERPA